MQWRDLDVPELELTAEAGICSTCTHRAGCTWRAHATAPIWRCDEFDAGRQAPRAFARSEAAPTARDGAQGLCVNCANAASCTLPGRSGGVWFCEEHR